MATSTTYAPRKIWCGSCRPEYRLVTQRYRLPARCIPLMQPDQDIVLLPGNHKATQAYWELCRDVLGLKEEQAIFTSDASFVMDDDVTDEIIARLRETILAAGPLQPFLIVPYCVTDNFLRWANQLLDLPNVELYGDHEPWVARFGHKGILHRHMSCLDQPSLLEEIAPDVRVPVGFTCSTASELEHAYQLIAATTKPDIDGQHHAIIKPIFGAAGEGIEFVSSQAQLTAYTFPMGDVVLEERLNLDLAPDGTVLSPAVHYVQSCLIGGSLLDQIMVGTGYSGWRRSFATERFQQACKDMAESIIKAIRPSGPGGFDFLSSAGLPYLTDVNTGRFNGAHYPRMFQEQYAPDAAMYCWMHRPPSHITPQTFWRTLCNAGLAFLPNLSRSGVFPLVYLQELNGIFVAFADTHEECLRLRHEAMRICFESDVSDKKFAK